MAHDDLRFVTAVRETGRTSVHRRYRFRTGSTDIDAIVPDAAARVWHQAHPGATDEDLDEWATREGERLIRSRLAADPLNVADVVLDRDVDENRERPRYGEGGMPHR